MIEESYVSFDTAKLLKEVGFDVPTVKYFHKDKTIGKMSIDAQKRMEQIYPFDVYPCPTQSLVAKWLRNVYKIHVCVDFNHRGWYYLIYDITNEERLDVADSYEISYETAIENGLQEAIKLIKK